MKKNILPAIALLIIIFITIFLLCTSAKEIHSASEIDVIKQDSNLDILVNLGNFSADNYSESNLLDVAMQYASKLNLMNETSIDGVYLQYVTKDDLHSLINELTGLTIEAPIEIEDFYYLFDSENQYYYYIGYSPIYYSVSNIDYIKRDNNKFFIKCSIEKIEDGERSVINDVYVTLIRNLSNSSISYQVEKIVQKSES